MSKGLASELGAALSANGIEMHSQPDTQTVTMPLRGTEVEVPRIHPAWQLYEGSGKVAGIPNKNRVAGPAIVDRHVPEIAVARMAEAATGADAWWTIWNPSDATIRGVPGSADPGRERPIPFPELIAQILGTVAQKTREIVGACEKRWEETGEEWRADAEGRTKRPMGGGIWDVVISNGVVPLKFFVAHQCK